jgi:hypothetical protein
MIGKQQLAASMLRECDICVHLHSKLTALGPAAFEHRPVPGQRSALELLRYLAICGIAGTRCLAESNWKLFGDFSARVAEMQPQDFPAAMERQKQELASFFAQVDERTLETQPAKLPTGVELPLGAAILEAPFKWLAAYKLQLFLYAKAAGAAEIGTANAWAGRDRSR